MIHTKPNAYTPETAVATTLRKTTLPNTMDRSTTRPTISTPPADQPRAAPATRPPRPASALRAPMCVPPGRLPLPAAAAAVPAATNARPAFSTAAAAAVSRQGSMPALAQGMPAPRAGTPAESPACSKGATHAAQDPGASSGSAPTEIPSSAATATRTVPRPAHSPALLRRHARFPDWAPAVRSAVRVRQLRSGRLLGSARLLVRFRRECVLQHDPVQRARRRNRRGRWGRGWGGDMPARGVLRMPCRILVQARRLPRQHDAIWLHLQRGRHCDLPAHLSPSRAVHDSGGRDLPVRNVVHLRQLRRGRRNAAVLLLQLQRIRLLLHDGMLGGRGRARLRIPDSRGPRSCSHRAGAGRGRI
jgi:hypothetical protein